MNIYFPIISTPPIPIEHPQKAKEFFELLKSDIRQKRKVLVWSDLLEEAASIRTESLASLNYWAHCEPNGPCPNEVARSVGCVFPSSYSQNGNDIESIVAGSPIVAIVFKALADSIAHMKHMFGLESRFERQTSIGIHVRYNANSTFKWYYSILIAELI